MVEWSAPLHPAPPVDPRRVTMKPSLEDRIEALEIQMNRLRGLTAQKPKDEEDGA